MKKRWFVTRDRSSGLRVLWHTNLPPVEHTTIGGHVSFEFHEKDLAAGDAFEEPLPLQFPKNLRRGQCREVEPPARLVVKK